MKIVLECLDVANAQKESTKRDDEHGRGQRCPALISPVGIEMPEYRMPGQVIDLCHDFRQAILDKREESRAC